MSFATRFGDALQSGHRAVGEYERAHGDGEPGEPSTLTKYRRSLGVFVFGLGPEEIARLAKRARKIVRRRDEYIIFITDRNDISVFQLDGIITEYVPPPMAISSLSPDQSAELYAARRLDLIRNKWNLRQIHLFGSISRQQADSWQAISEHVTTDFFVDEA